MATHAAHRAPRRRSGLHGPLLVTLAVGFASLAVLPQLKQEAAAMAAEVRTAESVAASDILGWVALPLLVVEKPPAPEVSEASFPVPANSGEGRRIVFSETEQRVWLVEKDGDVARTYLVSGSKFDNLDPGTYSVSSKQRHATAFDASGTMEYFVRFATGWTAPIGFHTVPKDNSGNLEQTREQLGTPLSAGCVRQWREDAVALWEWAPLGTTVVVV